MIKNKVRPEKKLDVKINQNLGLLKISISNKNANKVLI
jgi:hypothetical protein